MANGFFSLEDWAPTLMAAAGETDIKQKLLDGYAIGDKTLNVHLDDYDQLPYLAGESDGSPRREFFAWVDDCSLGAVRVGPFKAHFSTQEHEGINVWSSARPRARLH